MPIMKPKINFQEGNRLIIANSRDFSELPPINQELTLRDERYKVVGYESAVVLVKLVPAAELEQRAPRQNKAKAKRAAKVQKKAAHTAKKSASKGKITGDGKSESTAVRGNFYNRKGN
jgi:hypothetical protein